MAESSNDEASSAVNQRIPHYALPNTAHVLPRYANQEQDNVKLSFQTGNFRSLKLLPDDIRPDGLNAMDANHAAANLRSTPVTVHGSWKRIDPHGCFHRFAYRPDPYHGVLLEIQKEQRMAREAKAQECHERPFRCGTTQTHEQEEKDYRDLERENEDLVLNYAPFSDIEDQRRRHAALARAKVLHGPMVPSGRTKPLAQINRLHIPEMMKALTVQIDGDWEDSEFYIYNDDDDLIILEFNIDSIDSHDGLWAYMNMMLQCNKTISEFHLSKVVELWNHMPGDGNVYYAFRPPWVRQRRDATYFTLHPERRTFAALQAHERRRNAAVRERQRQFRQEQSQEIEQRRLRKEYVPEPELDALERELSQQAGLEHFNDDDDDDDAKGDEGARGEYNDDDGETYGGGNDPDSLRDVGNDYYDDDGFENEDEL